MNILAILAPEVIPSLFNMVVDLKDHLAQGRRSQRKSPGAKGGTFFEVDFYSIFGRFGKMTHIVNLKKCRGSSPGCPG